MDCVTLPPWEAEMLHVKRRFVPTDCQLLQAHMKFTYKLKCSQKFCKVFTILTRHKMNYTAAAAQAVSRLTCTVAARVHIQTLPREICVEQIGSETGHSTIARYSFIRQQVCVTIAVCSIVKQRTLHNEIQASVCDCSAVSWVTW